MKIDKSMLPEGFNTVEKEGLYAEFHDNGSLAYAGCYREGVPVGWTLNLKENMLEGVAELRDINRFPDDKEDAAKDDPEAFKKWVLDWISAIHETAVLSRHCAFCRKRQDQVRRLIAGPGVYICDECVDLCHEIVSEERSHDKPAAERNPVSREIRFVDISTIEIDKQVASIIPESLARRYHLICIEKRENEITLAMADPLDEFAIDDIRFRTGLDVESVLAKPEDIEKALDSIYGK